MRGADLQRASATVVRGDAGRKAGERPEGRKSCGQEPLGTFSTAAANQHKKNKRTDYSQGSVDNSQTERVSGLHTGMCSYTPFRDGLSRILNGSRGGAAGPRCVCPPHDSSRRAPPPRPPLPSLPAWQPRVCPVSADGRFDVSD